MVQNKITWSIGGVPDLLTEAIVMAHRPKPDRNNASIALKYEV